MDRGPSVFLSSENPAIEFKNPKQFLPDNPTQDNDLILTLSETRFYKFIEKKGERFKVNLNLTKYRTNFSFKTIDKIAILSTGLYIFDVGSDGLLSYYFVHGTNYTKTVANITDKAITDFHCTQIGHHYHNMTEQTTYTFNCFEQVGN
jgi:hypothetical protein